MTDAERLGLLQIVYETGEWTEAWVTGIESLIALFPAEPWMAEVERLAEDSFGWRAIMERYQEHATFYGLHA